MIRLEEDGESVDEGLFTISVHLSGHEQHLLE